MLFSALVGVNTLTLMRDKSGSTRIGSLNEDREYVRQNQVAWNKFAKGYEAAGEQGCDIPDLSAWCDL
jgi:hypothetical protein